MARDSMGYEEYLSLIISAMFRLHASGHSSTATLEFGRRLIVRQALE